MHKKQFSQATFTHLLGGGCKQCGYLASSVKNALPLNTFISRANERYKHGRYSFEKVKYENYNTQIIIVCSLHGQFIRFVQAFLKGHGCSSRALEFNESGRPKYNAESFIKKSNEVLGPIYNYDEMEFVDANTEVKIKCLKADGYYKEKNTILEFHGCFFHGCTKCFKNRDNINKLTGKTFESLYKKTKIKEQHCKDHGYNYISIWECHWNKKI